MKNVITVFQMFYTQLCISRHRELIKSVEMNFDPESIGVTEPMLYPFGSLEFMDGFMDHRNYAYSDRLMEIVYGTEGSI